MLISLRTTGPSLELDCEQLIHEGNEIKLFGFPKKRVPPREANPNFRKFLPRKLACDIVATIYPVVQHCSNICCPKNRFDRVTSSLVKFDVYQVNVIIGKAVVT